VGSRTSKVERRKGWIEEICGKHETLDTHGDPHSVSAIIAFGRDRAKPKSATLRRGTPRGWVPRASSAAGAGQRRRFCGLTSR
jgi:hypothetical protein